ncbi:MAG: ABC transporter permease [Desulfomonilaceae bacterium]
MSNKSSYILAVTLLLCFWQFGAMLAGPNVVATPLATLEKLLTESQSQRFWKHVEASSFRIFCALVISFVTAIPLGLYLGSSRRADKIAKPLIYLTYPVPKIVFLPLVLLIFGIGDLSKIMLLSLIMFFQLLITARDSARAVSKAAKYSLKSLGGNRWDLFVHVIWPSTLPSVFTALRIATGTVVAVLFFVESIGARYGIGFYILDAWGRADVPQIYAGITVLALMGVVLYETFDILERVYCRWNQL